ncbi:MAG: hypothetical protein ACLFS7_00750 [Desulfosudaceae bacterium]
MSAFTGRVKLLFGRAIAITIAVSRLLIKLLPSKSGDMKVNQCPSL